MLARLKWTPSELARRSNLNPDTISDIVNLKIIPTEKEANAIQAALGDAGEFLDVLELWPFAFGTLKRGWTTGSQHEVHWESLWGHPEAMEQPAREEGESELELAVEQALSRLPKRTYKVLKHRYWKGQSHQRIGVELGVTRSRVRQIESNALRRLKYSTGSLNLRTLCRGQKSRATSIHQLGRSC